MILTCPDCATRYVVPDDRVGPEGRTVRCARCGSSWRARPAEDAAPTLTLEAGPIEPAVRGGDDPARAFRDRRHARRRTVRAAAVGAVAGVLGVALLLAAVAALVFRSGVVAAWPGSAGVFAAIGLPVNATGLVFEDVTAQPDLNGGRPRVIVSGAIRNVSDRTVTPPPVRAALLDGGGRELAVTVARPGRAAIPAGESRQFALALRDPPAAARDVDVTFAVDAPPSTPPQRRAVDPPRLAPRTPPSQPTAPEPENARALPPGSPYALAPEPAP